MSISAVAASSTITATSITGTESSKYTAVVDQYAKILAPDSTASFDEQFKAFSGFMKLLWGNDENGQAGILWRANQSDCERAGSALMNSDMMKRAASAQERLARAQQGFSAEILDKQSKGEPVNTEGYLLNAFSKLSIEDQKLVFAANGNGRSLGMSDGSGGSRSTDIEFASLDDFKTFLKNRADAFARDQANRRPTIAPAASALVSTEHQTSNATSTTNKGDSSNSPGVKALSAKPPLPSAPPTAGMINAAIALQVLQSTSKASSASNEAGQTHPPETNAATSTTASQMRDQHPSVKLNV